MAVARARYADGALHDVKDVWVGEGVGGPTTVALTPDSKLWIGTTEGGQHGPRIDGGRRVDRQHHVAPRSDRRDRANEATLCTTVTHFISVLRCAVDNP